MDEVDKNVHDDRACLGFAGRNVNGCACAGQKHLIRVQIIQPLIPAYRMSLFRSLAEHNELLVNVCAARIAPSTENLKSVEAEGEYEDLEHPIVGFFQNRLLWQRRLRLGSDMTVGDVVVLGGNLRYLSNFWLMWKAKKRKLGIVWWAHGFSKRRNWFKDALSRFVVQMIDVRLLYTDNEIEAYAAMRLPRDKLFALNNTIDERPVREATEVWTDERLRRFQNREDLINKHVLLFCGRRLNSVSLADVVAAMARLKNANDNYLFAIIGSDNGAVDKDLAADYGVRDCVRWLGAIYDQHHLAPWFLTAQCFVCPGAIGLGLLHSFAYGLPVIIPRIPLHGPEIAAFAERENGLYYREADVDDLAEKIDTIASNPQYQHELSQNALRTVLSSYSMDRMVDRYVAAIKVASEMSCRRRTRRDI